MTLFSDWTAVNKEVLTGIVSGAAATVSLAVAISGNVAEAAEAIHPSLSLVLRSGAGALAVATALSMERSINQCFRLKDSLEPFPH